MFSKIKKLAFVAILSLFSAFSPFFANPAKAFWGEFVQENYHFLLKDVYDMIRVTILTTLKQQAIESLNEEVDNLIAGTGDGNVKFVTDWEGFLEKEPKDKATKYASDLITQATGGKGSVSLYNPARTPGYVAQNFEGVGPGSFDFGLAQANPFHSKTALALSAGSGNSNPNNYMAQLAQGAKKSVEDKPAQVTFEGNPSEMFADGTAKKMSQYLSGINNPWAFNLYISQKRDEKLAAEKEIAKTESIANQGFKSTKQNGQVVTPGILTKEATANVRDMGNKALAAAQHPGEIFAAVLSKIVKREVANMRSRIDREIKSVGKKVSRERDRYLDQFGPKAVLRDMENRNRGR